ncbi:MAG: hypothetical protein DRN15_04645 [Thermoprotei archaeon]|nr:MAG: hypothetical protein DRN15_04645 [Thermoprotei archaeon]
METLILLSVLGPIITIIASVSSLAYWLGKKFAHIDEGFKQVDERFKEMDRRFEQIDRRFEQIDRRFEQIDERFRQVDRRFEQIDERFKRIDERFTALEKRIESLERRVGGLEERVGGLERRFGNFTQAITRASIEAHSVIADFLSIKDIVTSKEAEFLKKRIKGIFEVYTAAIPNPLTKEELEFILKVFSKPLDEITIEEMDRAYEIGKRLFSEDFDERGFILAVGAAYIRAYLRSKKYKEERKAQRQQSQQET